MRILTYILLSLLFTSAYAQDYTDSIMVNLTNTSINAAAPWYNKPNNTTALSLKYGASINAGVAYSYYNFTASCSGYVDNARNTEHYAYRDSMYYVISGLNIGDTMLAFRSLFMSDTDPDYPQIMYVYVNNVLAGTSEEADANACGVAFVDSISVGSGESVRVTIKSAASNTDLYVNTVEMYWMPTGEVPPVEHCDTVTIGHSAIVTNEDDGAGDGAIDYTPSGGTVPYTFSWNSGTYITEDLTGLSAGNYTVITIDDSLCESDPQLYTVINIVPSTSDTLQAEDAYWIDPNLSVLTGISDYHGTGHVGNFDNGNGDSIIFQYTPDEAGYYSIEFRVGDRPNNYYFGYKAGGSYLSTIYVTGTDAWNYTTLNLIELEAGVNTITVYGGWGYFTLDEIVIKPYVAIPYDYSNIKTSLANSNSDTATANLYTRMRLAYGKKIISGYTDRNIYDVYGDNGNNMPKIWAGDFDSYTVGFGFKWVTDHHEFGWVDANQVDTAIAMFNLGHIITFQWHWYAPSGGHGPSTILGYYGEVPDAENYLQTDTDFDILDAINPDSVQYTWMLQDVDSIASQLKRLEVAGVPILFRPLHEADLDNFWWGQGDEWEYDSLWNIIYDRLINYHELTNIIWVSAPTAPSLGWQPDLDKLDIIGYDFYNDSRSYSVVGSEIDSLRVQGGDSLMVAFTEVGAIPYIDHLYVQDKVPSYVTAWADYSWNAVEADAQNSYAHLVYTFSHDSIINLEDALPSIPDIVINYRVTDSILINVVGFLPNATKYAIFRDTSLTNYYLVDSITNTIVVENTLISDTGSWRSTDGEALFTPKIKRADFSSYTTEGTYYLIGYNSTDTVRGYDFKIDSTVYRDVVKTMWRSFYQNRTSSTIAKGGTWGRNAGYPMDEVILHNSAANGVTRLTGDTIIAWKNGWHDAGDYNVYPTNYGQPLFNMLFAYEMYPEYYNALTWDLPETGNGLPDILNTAIDGLRFLIYAQDPYDGGIYSVETSTEFEPYWTYSDLLPENYTFTPHYWTRKSTNATRVGGAVLYMGARIFESLGYTDFSDSCLAAAEKANNWQRANPIVQYDMASLTSPAIETGDYQCSDLPNAYHWINAECYITTGRQGAYDSLITSLDFGGFYNTPSYGSNHEIYAIMSMGINNAWQSTDSATYMPELFNIIDDQITYFKSANATWKTSMGTENQGDFPWGSNSYLGTRITMQLLAYNMTGDSDYLNMATNDIDYIMGRNAVGRCFITGFGEGNHQITEIHHRQSICDGITAPVPGLLSGGPSNVEYDQGGGTPVVDYTGLEIAEHWVHNHNSFCSNETAINWVAPVAAAISMLDAMYYTLEVEPEPEPSTPSVLTGRVISGGNGKVYSKNGAIKVRPNH